MVSEEHRTGLYISVPVYFCVLSGAAYWAYLRVHNMKIDDAVADNLAAHYLGGRDFGPILTAGTLFASLFSGYTVIGVPNEAYKTGWVSADWIPSLMGLIAGYFGTGMRLLRTGQIRDHQSPADFITDRYQSQILRYTIVFLQVLPTTIYLSAQVIAIKGTFNSIFELDPDTIYPTICITALILMFEWAGGLNSVAYCDTIQACTMMFSFILIPSVICANFGGWSNLDPHTYPKPQYYQTPSKPQQWDIWQFSLINISFFTLPHLMQRTYSASGPSSLKAGYFVMAIGPWFTTFVGVYMGTMGVQILFDKTGELQAPSNPFSTIIEALMDEGGIAKVGGVIAVTASLAAIMSTADSLIIAISQLITVEIIYPLRPNTTPSEINIIGKIVSLSSCTFALLIGNFWDEGVSDLGKIQFALSAQALPVFLFGLFSTNKRTDVHPWCLTGGALSSTIFVIAIYFGYLKPANDSVNLNSGIGGICVQLTVTFLLESARRLIGGAAATEDTPVRMMKGEEEVEVWYGGRPEWDIPLLQRFGQRALTPHVIWDSMKGINEPMASPWVCFMMFYVFSMACPWTPPNEPPIVDGEFLYTPVTINGLPWWYFKMIWTSFVGTALIVAGIYNISEEFPEYIKEGEEEYHEDDEDLKAETGVEADKAVDDSGVESEA